MATRTSLSGQIPWIHGPASGFFPLCGFQIYAINCKADRLFGARRKVFFIFELRLAVFKINRYSKLAKKLRFIII